MPSKYLTDDQLCLLYGLKPKCYGITRCQNAPVAWRHPSR